MDRFEDVSVVASVDESPPPRRMPRGVRRALTGVIAAVVATGALAGAAVGLADEKTEPAPSASSGTESSPVFKRSGRECEGKRHKRSSAGSSFRY